MTGQMTIDELGFDPHKRNKEQTRRRSDVDAIHQALQKLKKNKVGASHRNDPPTSRAAAKDNFPRSGTQRMNVLYHIRRKGEVGATFDEVKAESGIYSADRRMTELKQGGWIEANGETRKTRTGSQAEVFVLTRKALDRLASLRAA